MGRPFLPSYAASLPHVLLPYLAYGRSWLALGWAEIVHRFCVAVGGEAVVVFALVLVFAFSVLVSTTCPRHCCLALSMVNFGLP